MREYLLPKRAREFSAVRNSRIRTSFESEQEHKFIETRRELKRLQLRAFKSSFSLSGRRKRSSSACALVSFEAWRNVRVVSK